MSDQIEQILGLNAEQFKQIILLPQNDFSRFLKEDSKTKTQILKKIFGTGIFDHFQKSLEERLRQSNKDMEKRQAQLDVILPVRFGLRKNYPSWSKRQPLKN